MSEHQDQGPKPQPPTKNALFVGEPISLNEHCLSPSTSLPPPGHLRSGAGQPENVVRPLQRAVLRAAATKNLMPSGCYSGVHMGKGVQTMLMFHSARLTCFEGF